LRDREAKSGWRGIGDGSTTDEKWKKLMAKTMSFWARWVLYFWNPKQCSFGVRGKISIVKDFLYGMDKVRENQSLIHLSERF
jgi:hypothetical protein